MHIQYSVTVYTSKYVWNTKFLRSLSVQKAIRPFLRISICINYSIKFSFLPVNQNLIIDAKYFIRGWKLVCLHHLDAAANIRSRSRSQTEL